MHFQPLACTLRVILIFYQAMALAHVHARMYQVKIKLYRTIVYSICIFTSMIGFVTWPPL